MDLTPEALRSVEFRRKGRGYDADDVDAFRQKVEVWVGETQARLREATAKLEEAETRARDAEERARTSTEGDETIQRTLLLAQRTADAAVKEAEETASRKVAEAEAEAELLTSEARNHRERAIAEAEGEVREAMDTKRAELLDELTTLERVREQLQGDVAALEAHIEGQRDRIQESRDMLGVLLDEPGKLAPAEAPALSGAEIPEPAPVQLDVSPEPTPLPVEPEQEPEPDVLPEPLATEVAEPEPFAPVDSFTETTAEPDPFAAPAAAEADPWGTPPESSESVFGSTGGGDDLPAPTAEPEDTWSTVSEDAWADTPPPPPPPPADLDVDDAAWADAPPPPPPPPPDFELPGESAPSSTATFGGLSGPAVPPLEDVAEGDNPWLDELDHETDGKSGDRSRFGRRR